MDLCWQSNVSASSYAVCVGHNSIAKFYASGVFWKMKKQLNGTRVEYWIHYTHESTELGLLTLGKWDSRDYMFKY